MDKLAGYHRRSISVRLWGRLEYVVNIFALFPMNKEGPWQCGCLGEVYSSFSSILFFFFFTCEEQEPVKVVQVSEEDVSCVSW